MSEELWDRFVIYVNAYYAVQEAYDAARRSWERPAEGLDAFCRDANPFVWDGEGSAEEAIYEGFSAAFDERFDDAGCTGEQGHAFVRAWLAGLEGGAYGTELVASFDAVCDEDGFDQACDPVQRQILNRAVRLERSPQEDPELVGDVPVATPSKESIEAVIELLAHGDAAFAQSLRERL